MKGATYLQAAWRIFRICMKLSKEERDELRQIVEEKDEVGFHFFLKHHWQVV